MSRTERRNADEHKSRYNPYEEKHVQLGNINHRDKKEGDKPPSWYKKLRRQMRRSKEKQAMRENKEAMPKFKHDDQWNWT